MSDIENCNPPSVTWTYKALAMYYSLRVAGGSASMGYIAKPWQPLKHILTRCQQISGTI